MEQSATKAAVYMLCFWTAHVSHILASSYNGKKTPRLMIYLLLINKGNERK